MDYQSEVEDEARSFIIDNEDMMVKALKNDADFDYNDIDDLDSYWHETIVDRGYTLEDAAYILDNCENEEWDTGIWEGMDARDAMSARAAYSYSNDVWFKCEEMWKEIKDRMQELVDDENVCEDEAAQLAFDEFEDDNEHNIVPVEKGSEDEIHLIREWLQRNDRDAGMRGGYPVGGSYIDSRCGTGHGMPEVKDYVDFDHEFAQRVPWLSGKYKDAVQNRYDELVDLNRKYSEVHWAGLDRVDNVESRRMMISDNILSDCRLKVSDIRIIIRNLERGV
jgi:hypothetical protein